MLLMSTTRFGKFATSPDDEGSAFVVALSGLEMASVQLTT